MNVGIAKKGSSFAVLSLLLMLAFAGQARAGMPHYANGALGLGAATMPVPGWYYTNTSMYYSAKQIRDNNGNKISKSFSHPHQRLNFRMETFTNSHTVTYSSDFKIFGARWIANFTVPLVYYRMKATDTFDIPLPNRAGSSLDLLNKRSLGISDLYTEPVVLSWGGDRYDITLNTGVFIPVGRFDKTDPTSPGMGYWTIKPGAGFTWYFDREKAWSFSLMAGYEFQFKQRETNITPGEQFHYEWGLGKRFASYWQVGVAGYDSWQITRDTGPDASPHKYQAHGIGPEINVVIPKLGGQLTLRSQWEYLNRNAPQGSTTTLSLSFSF